MAKSLRTVIYYGLAFFISTFIVLAFFNIDQDSTKRRNVSPVFAREFRPSRHDHKLAIIVPFRDRYQELMEFVPSLGKFLEGQKRIFHIFVINQVDGLRFNRGALLNAGFLEVPAGFDHVALHDVDLIPLNPELQYSFPDKGPLHLAAPSLHPRYHYPTFIGGILIILREHFRKVDGMSNKYWGWGLEDDEFYARLKESDLRIQRPTNISTTSKNTFKHIHNRAVRTRDMVKCFNQRAITRKRDRETGLSTTKYQLLGSNELMVDGYKATILNVELACDFKVTPWCNCSKNVGNTGVDFLNTNDADVIAPKIDRKKHLSLDA